MKITNSIRTLLGVSMLLGAGLAVRADDAVTFKVDLSRYTNSAGQQAATLVDVRGAFNSWNGGSTLLNNGANVYTNTITITGAAGATFEYKFTFTTPMGVTWEDSGSPPVPGQPPNAGGGTGNRVLQLVGGAQTVAEPPIPFYAPSVSVPIDLPHNLITYQVDMTEQIRLGNFIPDSGVETIRVTGAPGALTSWGAGVDMTNNAALSGNASNIYSAVIDIQGMPGVAGGDYKFRMNGGYEETFYGTNRNFKIAGGSQVLPLCYFYDQSPGAVTNANIMFQVDMTPQVTSGGFINGVGTVGVAGHMLSTAWPTYPMTNDPSLSGNASNVYSTTISIAVPPGTVPTTTVGLPFRYKFRADGGWESAAIYGVNGNKDRQFIVAGGDQILPLVTYNDASLCDVLLKETSVKFVVHLANGTMDNNGIPFDKVNDKVYINADFLKWPAWNNSLPEMTNNPAGSDYYEQTIIIPGGNARRLQFKFGLDGLNHGFMDNENPRYSDHVKYVRDNSASYTIPAAEFGTNYLSTLVEPVIGDLKVGAPSGGNVPITWLGCPCATLQTKSTVDAGWTDLPATDGTSATNWPNAGGQHYFRVQRRPFP